jgi:hypothetical protein
MFWPSPGTVIVLSACSISFLFKFKASNLDGF